MRRVLLTGGCGFIGHHFVEHILKNTDWEVIIVDKLNYASNGFDRLRDIECFKYLFHRVFLLPADFSEPLSEGIKKEIGQVDYILHLGAESSVDNSILDPKTFVMANVVGTMNMLEYAKTQKNLIWFNYFSTDEVFGPAPEGTFYKEWDRYNSTNPYSATKAGGEELSLAYANTYKLPIFITHTMNVFGERQHPEKFIPCVIGKILRDEKVIIHSDPTKTIPGSRFYIHARNVANATIFLLDKAKQREKYNIVGEREVNNLDLARFIAKVLGKELKYEFVNWHFSRPGHDLRYALDGEKMQDMGYELPVDFEKSLIKTIKWFCDNPKWL